MKEQKEQKNDQFESVEVIEELSIEAKAEQLVITTVSEKAEITKNTIAMYKKEYMALKITSIEDKELIAQVSIARKFIKGKRSTVDNLRKALNADAIKHQKMVNKTATEIIEDLKEIETHLISQEDWVEKEKVRIAEEYAKKLEEALNYRIKKLVDIGLVFDGEKYSLGTVNVTRQFISEIDGETYDMLCEKATEIKSRIDAEAKAEADRLKAEAEKAEADRLKAEQERIQLEAENKRKDKELAEMKRKMEEMQAKIDAEEAQKLKEAEPKQVVVEKEVEKVVVDQTGKPMFTNVFKIPPTFITDTEPTPTPPNTSVSGISNDEFEDLIEFLEISLMGCKFDSQHQNVNDILSEYYASCKSANEIATIALQALKNK
jgi:hypothetical protein